MKRITLILPDLIAGGAQRIVLNLAKGFIENNYQVDLLLLTNKGNFFGKIPVKVKLLRLRNNLDLSYFISLPLSGFKFIRYLHKNSPDILISSLTGTNLFILALRKLSGIKIPLIVIEHSVLKNVKCKIIKLMIKRIYPLADKIVCVSEGIQSDLLSLGIEKNKLVTINNPIDIEYVLRQSILDCPHPWIQNKTTPVVLAVGRLVEAKGFDVLLQAFSQVLKNTSSRLIILGEGPLRERLVDLSKRLEISQHIDFVGYVDNPYSYIKQSDVFVLSSKWEGFVGVLLEAMALGTSVVATNCWASPSEILKNGQIGKLVPANDPSLLAEAIISTLLNPQNRVELMTRASEFKIENIVKKYVDLINLNIKARIE